MIDDKTMNELQRACEIAIDHAAAFNDAVKAQAEKHNLDPQALGRFIRAKVRDKLEKLEAEQDTMEQLSIQFVQRVDNAA